MPSSSSFVLDHMYRHVLSTVYEQESFQQSNSLMKSPPTLSDAWARQSPFFLKQTLRTDFLADLHSSHWLGLCVSCITKRKKNYTELLAFLSIALSSLNRRAHSPFVRVFTISEIFVHRSILGSDEGTVLSAISKRDCSPCDQALLVP